MQALVTVPGSDKAVDAAMAGDVAVAGVKVFAAAVSGSSALVFAIGAGSSLNISIWRMLHPVRIDKPGWKHITLAFATRGTEALGMKGSHDAS
jgi:hypothetical protein